MQIKEITEIELDEQKRQLIERLLEYTTHSHASLARKEKDCAKIVAYLISIMVVKTKFNFGNDTILYEGLMKHIQSLLQRMHDGVEIGCGQLPYLSEKEKEIIYQVRLSLSEIDALKQLHSEMKTVYIVFHFIAGLKRRERIQNKKVLLVCG
ncbi:MAG: PRD domain-containing protein [Erysipelotrichia bacterium]|nr:PRD domain-containing protein [Erysipelotrichia bacterium]NCC54221.1 PRD domain-containing protein [Erysipelotrichia bacterium]